MHSFYMTKMSRRHASTTFAFAFHQSINQSINNIVPQAKQLGHHLPRPTPHRVMIHPIRNPLFATPHQANRFLRQPKIHIHIIDVRGSIDGDLVAGELPLVVEGRPIGVGGQELGGGVDGVELGGRLEHEGVDHLAGEEERLADYGGGGAGARGEPFVFGEGFADLLEEGGEGVSLSVGVEVRGRGGTYSVGGPFGGFALAVDGFVEDGVDHVIVHAM